MLNAMITALKEERSGALRMLKSEYSGGITATVIDASRQIATLEVSRHAHKVFSLEPGDVLGYVCDGNVNYLGTVLDVSGDTVTVFVDSPNTLEDLSGKQSIRIMDYEFLLTYDVQLSLLVRLLDPQLMNASLGEGFTYIDVSIFNEYPLKLFLEKISYDRLRYSKPSSEFDVQGRFKLDGSQLKAVSAALGLRDNELLLIVGPPGTGKTRVIAKIAYELSRRGEKVLITSHTNRAVDNAIELLPLDNTLRVGRPEKVLKSIRPYLLSYKYRTRLGERLRGMETEISKYIKAINTMVKSLKKYYTGRRELISKIRKWKDILRELLCERAELIRRTANAIVNEVSVIGSTLIKSQLYPLKDVTFDTVIIDEASQASISLALLAMVKAKKWVIVGDHRQLLPIFKYSRASMYREELSVFKNLLDAYPQRHLWLTMHYRSNPAIIGFSAKYVYDGRIKPHESCAQKKLRLKRRPEVHALTPEKPVVFIHVRSRDESLCDNLGCTKWNRAEAEVVKVLVKDLLRCGVSPNTIGVITPYRGQRALVLDMIKGFRGDDIEVNTVDAFQGREKDVIIYSVTSTGSFRFACERNRLNVALTRAKLKLVVVGNGKAITNAKDAGLLLKFIKYCLELNSVYDWDKKEWIRCGKHGA